MGYAKRNIKLQCGEKEIAKNGKQLSLSQGLYPPCPTDARLTVAFVRGFATTNLATERCLLMCVATDR